MTEHPKDLVARLRRPIAGIENRTALEVFDIMSDRIRSALEGVAIGTTPPRPCGFAGTPEGYLPIPEVPTEAMLAASWRATLIATPEERMEVALMSSEESHNHKARRRWAAMVAAAPEVAEQREKSDG